MSKINDENTALDVGANVASTLVSRRRALHIALTTMAIAAADHVAAASSTTRKNTEANGVVNTMANNSQKPVSALGSDHQRLIEQRALGIFTSAPVQAAMAETLVLFKNDPNAKLPNQEALMQNSVKEHFFHSSLIAASENPTNPYFVWCIALPHQWLGLDVPGSRFGHDNTDNAYRIAAIDPAMRYQLSGRFSGQHPCDFSICALPKQVGENIAADVIAFIPIDNIDVDADGRFSVTLDATPTNGRRNHLCIAGAKVLFSRDTMADWAVERPSELRLTRSDGPTIDDFNAESASTRAATLGIIIAKFFLKNVQHGMFERAPVNTIPVPVPSGPRGGLTTQLGTLGIYQLADDEALVISADRLGARYLSIQIIDMWMLSYEYSRHTSSFNHAQAMLDDDGRFRWVISARDPGVYNWLDGSGNAYGNVLFRWQMLPPGVDVSGCVTTEVVKLNALREHLPRSTRFLNATEREAQRARRLQDYQNRVV